LKFIFYTIIILWILRRVGGFFFKSWIQSAMNEQQKRAQEQYNGQQNQGQKKREGDIFFTNKKSNKESRSDKIGGEYVDYEEVKD
jgi:hypothetical protein